MSLVDLVALPYGPLQKFLLNVEATDYNALREVCREFQKVVDAHDAELQKEAVLADLERVCRYSDAVYAVFWAIERGSKVLRVVAHYNPAHRIQLVERVTGEDKLYSTESYAYRFRHGEGLIGKCLQEKKRSFFEDVTDLPDDLYLRNHMAIQFGIKSVALLPYKEGILEFGTSERWGSFNWACTLPLNYNTSCRPGHPSRPVS
jgi:hypothetical protein